jgi:hypothetical protein
MTQENPKPMRLASILLALTTIASPLAFTPAAAFGQAGSAKPLPPCNGTYDIVRVSEIKSGQMQKFIEAVTAQQDWYKQKGLIDQIILDRVVDEKTGGWSETMAITRHTGVDNSGASRPQDDSYKAFVAMFNATSTIKATYYACQVTMEPAKPAMPARPMAPPM